MSAGEHAALARIAPEKLTPLTPSALAANATASASVNAAANATASVGADVAEKPGMSGFLA